MTRALIKNGNLDTDTHRETIGGSGRMKARAKKKDFQSITGR